MTPFTFAPRILLGLGLLAGVPEAAFAQGSGEIPGANAVTRPEGGSVTTCSARNALGTNQCTSTCPAGQTATCEDSDDSSNPRCECTKG